MSSDNEDAAMNKAEVSIKVGLSVNTYSPELGVSRDMLEAAEEGNLEPIAKFIGEWWDSLSLDERAAAMKLDQKDGHHIAENMFCVDNVESGQIEVVWDL